MIEDDFDEAQMAVRLTNQCVIVRYRWRVEPYMEEEEGRM